MRNQTIPTIQAPRANGRPAYEVVTVQTSEALSPDTAFISVTLLREQLAAGQPAYRMQAYPMPGFSLGSLVLFGSDNVCTHAGIINNVTEQEGRRDFTFAAWPLESEVSLLVPRVPDARSLRYVRYVAEGRVNDDAFVCRVAKVPHVIGNDMREQIGLDLPEHLLDIYWSENDLKRLRSLTAGRQRFAELVNQQLAELAAEMDAI